MKQIKCGLIVSDFDGTLIDSDHRIKPDVRAAINEYVSCGGIFAVCTGRMLRSILPQVRALGLKGLVVAYQGTVMAEIESGKIIKCGSIGWEKAAEVCKLLESLSCTYNVYSQEILFTNIPKDNEYLQLYERITCVEANYISGLSSYVEENKLDCQKIACLVAPKEQKELYDELYKRLSDNFDVTCSANCLVEISPKDDDKGAALKFLAGHYGIPIEKTVAAGDNLNDLPMIKAAGTGVAVGNAVEPLKQAADFVSVTNDEGAIKQIIYKYGFA